MYPIFTASDEGLISLQVLLNLSAAFDTINHYIILQRMEHQFGIKGSALRWFKSFLSDRYNFVHVNDESPKYDKISHIVPQDSGLAPILFTLYI